MAEPQKKSGEATIGADAAGVGGGCGTILVALAESLPPDDPWRPWLLYLAPSVTVILSGLWLYAKYRVVEWARNRDIDTVIQQAKKLFQDAVDNPNTSPEHVDVLRSEIEELERQKMKGYKAKIKLLAHVSE